MENLTRSTHGKRRRQKLSQILSSFSDSFYSKSIKQQKQETEDKSLKSKDLKLSPFAFCSLPFAVYKRHSQPHLCLIQNLFFKIVKIPHNEPLTSESVKIGNE